MSDPPHPSQEPVIPDAPTPRTDAPAGRAAGAASAPQPRVATVAMGDMVIYHWNLLDHSYDCPALVLATGAATTLAPFTMGGGTHSVVTATLGTGPGQFSVR